jgi:hypothetical protein
VGDIRDRPPDNDIIEGARKEYHFVDRWIDQIKDAIGGFDLHGYSGVGGYNRSIYLASRRSA